MRVLFVCLGNICRSPMAEGVFQDLVEKHDLGNHFDIESVGTGGWHVGEQAHRGTLHELKTHGIDLSHKRARQVSFNDIQQADFVIVMDQSNLRDLQVYNRNGLVDEKGHLLLDFAEKVNFSDVPDPYYEGGFDYVYELVEAGCRGLLAHIRQIEGI